jgi:D-alanyl-D-alanine carboxypeptidase
MHRTRRGLLPAALAAAAIAGLAGLGHHVRSGTVVSDGAALPQLVDRWRERAGVPAVTLAVNAPDRHLTLVASGTGLRDGGPPVTVDAHFRVASVTKMLQLAQEDRLRLDDTLSRYVPSFPGGDRITLRHLLNHTSGVPDFELADGFGKGLLADRQRRWRTDEILALVTGVRSDFAPGTRYSYSNTGYVLLGEVIRAVTGSTWDTEARRRIIGPLHLRHTYVAGAEPVPGGVLPGYYDADNDGDQENVETGQPWPALETAEGPAGAIVSTAADLAAFGDALFRGRLLAPAPLRQMLAEGPHHARNSNYGLGVEISRPDYRTTVWGHGGALPGFRSALWYVPSRDIVVVVLTNDWRANPQDLAELVVRAA